MTTASNPIRILIVDDHAIVRRGIKMVLSLRPEFQVVGEAGTANEALQQALDLQPNLILLDLVLPDKDGATLAPELRQYSPGSKILVLSAIQTTHLVRKAVEAGIQGYALKEVTPDELADAIREVANGQSYLHPKVTAVLARQMRGDPSFSPPDMPASVPALTKREHEVLALMATQATNREIAERMHVGEETVRTHVKGVLRKLNHGNRTQAVVEALRLGLIEL